MTLTTATAPTPAVEPPDDRSTPPLTVRVREACRLTGIGRSKLYELIKAGEIETIKVGHMTLIPMGSLARFIDAKRSDASQS